MKGSPFPMDPVLTGIVINYHNGTLIADRVLPRLNPRVMKKIFKYLQFDFNEGITIPDSKVGRKSEPATVEFSATDQTATAEDYGFDDIIPIDDINQAPQGYDPLATASMRLIDLVELDREVRVANKVFNTATYPAANKVTLAGASQWSSATGDPIADISAAMDAMIMRPNKLVLGQLTWSGLRKNANVLKAISISGTDKGQASLQAVQDLLEIEEIIVGSAFVNTAKPGQAAVRARTWGKHAVLMRQEAMATSMSDMPTFGWTAQYGERVAGTIDEPKIGLRGSVRVRSGETVGEVISASDLGYMFENAVA